MWLLPPAASRRPPRFAGPPAPLPRWIGRALAVMSTPARPRPPPPRAHACPPPRGKLPRGVRSDSVRAAGSAAPRSRTLVRQEPALAVHAAGVARQSPVRGDHAVTRDDDGD